MVIFCIIKFGSRLDLRGDRSESPHCQFFLVEITSSLSQRLLLICVCVDARSILGSHVIALSHALRWVVTLPEQFEQIDVGDLARTEHDPHYLCVASCSTAHLLVRRVLCVTSWVADLLQWHKSIPRAVQHYLCFLLSAPATVAWWWCH